MLAILFLAFTTVLASALENTTPLSSYKPVYFIVGKDLAKIQVSMKYDIFYPWNLGLYAAYTQTMYWEIFKASNPFRQIDFNPEFFLRFETKNNFLDNADLGFLDYFQLGLFEHKSNGEDGTNSRGYNRSYVQLQMSVGDFLNFGLNLKYFYIWPTLPGFVNDNKDIQDYIGSFECKVFLKLKGKEKKMVDYEELYASFGAGGGMNGFDFSKGWQEYGFMVRTLFSRVRPYVQVWHGYGESILDYNKYEDWQIRLGLIFE